MCIFFNDTATTEIYTLSLHDALPISSSFSSTIAPKMMLASGWAAAETALAASLTSQSDRLWPPVMDSRILRAPSMLVSRDRKEHTSELQSRQYLVCRLLLEKKTTNSL